MSFIDIIETQALALPARCPRNSFTVGRVHVDMSNMKRMVSSAQDHFLGHALWDLESTIIHHFDDPMSLAYPAISAGMVLSSSALNR